MHRHVVLWCVHMLVTAGSSQAINTDSGFIVEQMYPRDLVVIVN